MNHTPTQFKDQAIDFLHLASKGEARSAFQLYVGDNFKHHNAYFKGDGHTLMTAMDEDALNNPNKVFDIQRALEDGDLVAVHSRVQQTLGDQEIAVVHIFRFEKGKIVELWDLGMPAPKENINENGVF